jgi:hypothetical protein
LRGARDFICAFRDSTEFTLTIASILSNQSESAMTLRDGRPVVEIIYAGNGFAHAKVWRVAKNRARGYSQWQKVPLDLLPPEFLHDMRDAAEATLQQAA